MKIRKIIYVLAGFLVLCFSGLWTFKNFNFNKTYTVGQPVDSLNSVFVYYNGGVDNISGRNLAVDGYNLGLKYQCVEFVKRYYYEHFNHKMPDSYGHAKDFFNTELKDGQKNEQRDLLQYNNPSKIRPEANDLLIFKGTASNRYGHVAIVSKVMARKIEIIQQNPGPFGKSRAIYSLEQQNGEWKINNKRIVGWLRKE